MPTYSTVHILGDSLPARQVAQRLGKLYADLPVELLATTTIPTDHQPALVVAITRLDEVHTLDNLLRQSATVVYVGLWRSLIYIGPLWESQRKGCPHCLVTRAANAFSGPDIDRAFRVVPANYSPHNALSYPPTSLTLAATILAQELREHQAGRQARITGGVFILNTQLNEVTFEPLLPDSLCLTCGDASSSTLPVFTSAEVGLSKPLPTVLRTADVGNMNKTIKQLYLSPYIGLTKAVQHDLQSPSGACTLELPLKWGKKEPTIGRSVSYQKSQTIAVLEALERYAGWNRGGRPEVVRASFADVADHALNPLELGVHPDECYHLPDYPFIPFRPDVPLDWVWGYSFRQQRPVLVPERSASYGYRLDKEPTFVYETSNGCALGSSTEEAIIHGILELVERDSFLMTWYRRLQLPELSVADIPDSSVQALLSKGELFTGCQIRVFLSTMEHGIPSVWVMAIHEAEDGPCIMAGAGAHLSLTQALKGALYEVLGLALRTRHSYRDQRERALAMLSDPMLVRAMEDHALVNSLPEARSRFSFLLDQPSPRPFREVNNLPWQGGDDLRQDLGWMVHQILQTGLDVIVVDQTMSELRRGQFVCVRVIVPGLLPMTFGHMFRRVAHLPRLYAPSITTIYKSDTSSLDEVGLVPHPFP